MQGSSPPFDPEKEYEIVNNQPQEKKPSGPQHSRIWVSLAGHLGQYLRDNPLGALYGVFTAFQIGTNERMPDLSFVSFDRFPPEGETEGNWKIAPNLAVEVITPTDTFDSIDIRLGEYLSAGVQQVWLISMQQKKLALYRSITNVTYFAEADELISEDLFPGFRLKLGELFQLPTFS